MATKIGKQILQATSDRRITQREVQALLATAQENGKVSASEKRELKALLTKQASLFTAGAKAQLEQFLNPTAPVTPVTPPAGAAPAQVEFPRSTNPYYPNEVSWYAVKTGRADANGTPQYAFFSKGVAINDRPTVTHGGRAYALDKGMFRLGADYVRPNNAVASVEAGAPRANLPEWAKSGDASIVHAPENKPFLDALLAQLGPELVKHMLADARWYPELANVTQADIKNVKVDYVANYGQLEGRSGDGRRIAISFDLQTRGGAVKRMASDISDPFFTDPVKGGRYGFVTPEGNFVGRQPVDHVRIVS